MKFLETFGCIWSSKEVIIMIFGRALPGATSGSDYMKSLCTTSQSSFPRATARSRSRFHVRRHTDLTLERPPKAPKSLPMFRATCWSDTPSWRHENGPGATSRSDPSRSLPKPGATSRSDTVKSLWPALSERPYQSDAKKSLAFSSLGDTKTGPERRLAATPPGRSRSLERPLGATTGGEVLEIVEDGEGKTMKYVSEAYESEDGKLWIGVLNGRLGD
ncbi:hypothetical protein F2Q70_00026678 [Brassica cretica]|uniref:Uncharacterized protein n=1 Tax=Brassica cretica TaxID=69181 RepID=A0A8S9LAE9_BRACR|nr:hypothetical protein F2Q70_00026678 [Brassica cretica]